MSLMWEKIPSSLCLCNCSVYVPRNLRICATSRLRCAFSESWDCTMHCLTVVWNSCRDGALPMCWPLLYASSLSCLHTLWHVIPTSFYILKVFLPSLHLFTSFYLFILQLLLQHFILADMAEEESRNDSFDCGMFQSTLLHYTYICIHLLL